MTGLDFDPATVAALAGRAGRRCSSPGWTIWSRRGWPAAGSRFTTDAAAAVGDADVVWVAYDTPGGRRRSRRRRVRRRTRRPGCSRTCRDGALVLISSQLPVGTTRRLEQAFAERVAGTAASASPALPENLRLGKAIEVVHAARSRRRRRALGRPTARGSRRCCAPFTDRIEWMSVESAEMTKHALNAFLATSVTFINEIAALCEQVGRRRQGGRARAEDRSRASGRRPTCRRAPRSPAARWRATSPSSSQLGASARRADATCSRRSRRATTRTGSGRSAALRAAARRPRRARPSPSGA